MRRTSIRRTSILCFALLSSILAICANSAMAVEPPAELIAAAKAEKTVTVYTLSVPPIYQQIAAGFEKRYGIKVQFLEGRAAEVFERVRTEQATGKYVADILYTGQNSLAILARDGALDSYGQLPNAERIGDIFVKNGNDPIRTDMILPIHAAIWGVLINTKLVSPENEPASWKDVLDEKWRGKFLLDDPRTFGGGNVFFGATLDAFGREYHEKLATQQPVISREYILNQQRVARGEFSLFFPMNTNAYMRMAGLPVKLLMMKEGEPYVVISMSLLKGARHPNAAKLLMNYFLEDENQLKYPEQGWRNVVTALDSQVPEHLRLFQSNRLLGKLNSPERTEELISLANDIYRKR